MEHLSPLNFCAGHSVSLSLNGTRLAIGAPKDNGGLGGSWVFENNGSSYTEVGAGKVTNLNRVRKKEMDGKIDTKIAR